MVTTRLKNYTTEAVEVLANLLESDINGISETYCQNDCNSCKYKRLCEDLRSAHSYVVKHLKGRQGK